MSGGTRRLGIVDPRARRSLKIFSGGYGGKIRRLYKNFGGKVVVGQVKKPFEADAVTDLRVTKPKLLHKNSIEGRGLGRAQRLQPIRARANLKYRVWA